MGKDKQLSVAKKVEKKKEVFRKTDDKSKMEKMMKETLVSQETTDKDQGTFKEFGINNQKETVNKKSKQYSDAVSRLEEIDRVVGFGLNLHSRQKTHFSYFMDFVGFRAILKIVWNIRRLCEYAIVSNFRQRALSTYTVASPKV